MKIRNIPRVTALICGVFLMAAPASAHHSFAAEFDSTKCKDYTGTVKLRELELKQAK